MVMGRIIKGVVHINVIVIPTVFKVMVMAMAGTAIFQIMVMLMVEAFIFRITVMVQFIVFRIMVMEDITEQQDPIMVMQVTIIDEMLPIMAMVIIQVVVEA